MQDVNLETITDTLSWYRIWQLNLFTLFCAKQKLLRKHKRAYKSSWGRRGNQKTLTLTIPWNLAKPVKTYPGIIARQHLAVQKQMVLLKERYAELRKGLLQYCCNEVWMKNGGRIQRSVTAICETCKIPCLIWWDNTLLTAIRRTIQWTRSSIWLDDWMSPPFLPKTCPDATSSVGKFYLEYPSDMYCTREESGTET